MIATKSDGSFDALLRAFQCVRNSPSTLFPVENGTSQIEILNTEEFSAACTRECDQLYAVCYMVLAESKNRPGGFALPGSLRLFFVYGGAKAVQPRAGSL